MFCNRFLNIVGLAPPDLLKSLFHQEIGSLLDVIEDLLFIKRSTTITSQSRLTQVEGHDKPFFDGVIEKILQEKEQDQVTKQ